MTANERSGGAARLDRRLLLLRLLDRLKEGQAGSVRRLLSRGGVWFGRSPDRSGLTTSCRQCGRWESVAVFRLGRRRARYWCQRCGALVALPAAKLAPAGSAPGEVTPGADSASSEAVTRSESPHPREMLPLAMLRWAEARSPQPITVERLDNTLIYRLYQQWDAQLNQAGPAELAELADGLVGPLVPGLPAFPTVASALHNRCYRTELVVKAFLAKAPGSDSHATASRALWDRVEHARRWLAVCGNTLCWIHSIQPDGTLFAPDRDEVAAAIAPLRASDEPGAGLARAARGALFGTEHGPSLRRLRQVYTDDQLAAALAAYVDSGARPLREDVLARLYAPLAPPPRPGE